MQTGPPRRVKTPSPRAAAWLLVNGDEQLTEGQRAMMTKLTEVYPEMKTAKDLAQRFQRMMRERRAGEFDTWVTDATERTLPEMRISPPG